VFAIIDYGAGNLSSVKKACEHIGCSATITSDRAAILTSGRVVLPGVGAFGDAMQSLRKNGLDDVVREVVQRGLPLLGICLGLQLLFESSEESPGVEGLGLIKGRVVRIPDRGMKIPHMGWNTLNIKKSRRRPTCTSCTRTTCRPTTATRSSRRRTTVWRWTLPCGTRTCKPCSSIPKRAER